MKKTSILLVATFFVVLTVTLVSVAWVFIPAFIFNPEASYLVNQALSYSFYTSMVTGAIVLVIGIPVYLTLEYKKKISQVNLALVGFMIPVAIVFLIMFTSFTDSNGTYSSGQNYHGTYRDMVVENERTFWGWVSLTEQFITYGFYGLIGATLFGKIVSILDKSHKKT